ncbi:uncharacterized protein [Pyrus communis]|uniref:uncharacterized protein isoform X2 n=1 Tax=Pyrus communis TaxID=23211 RepID=UPI0035C22566
MNYFAPETTQFSFLFSFQTETKLTVSAIPFLFDSGLSSILENICGDCRFILSFGFVNLLLPILTSGLSQRARLYLLVEASTNQLADQQMPVYNLASKILCRIINVSLKAEPDTDEVFSQVTLLPESNFSEWLCHTLLFFLSKWGRFAWLSLFEQISLVRTSIYKLCG